MAIVETNFFQDDDVPTAAQLNAPYDALATASADIEFDNTSPNWITRQHIVDTATPGEFNEIYSKVDNTTGDFTTSSTAYVTVSNGSATEVTLNYQPQQFEILRINASGLVTNIDANEQFNALHLGKPNYYAFRLLLHYNDGGGTLSETLGEWGYSFTTSSGTRFFTGTGSGTNLRAATPIGFQTFQFSTLYKNTAASGRTLEKVILQCKVFDNSNVLAISRNAVYCIRPKA